MKTHNDIYDITRNNDVLKQVSGDSHNTVVTGSGGFYYMQIFSSRHTALTNLFLGVDKQQDNE